MFSSEKYNIMIQQNVLLLVEISCHQVRRLVKRIDSAFYTLQIRSTHPRIILTYTAPLNNCPHLGHLAPG